MGNPSSPWSSRRLAFTAEADSDLEGLLAYSLAIWGIEQRNAYGERLFDAMHKLVSHPRLGRSRDDLQPGLRVHFAGQHVIYYIVDDDAIRIVRILHSHMDPVRQIRPPQ